MTDPPPTAKSSSSAAVAANKHSNKQKHQKAKLTKQERRAKYTQLARQKQAADQARRRAHRLTCFHCRQMGHAVADCPQLIKSPPQQQQQQQQQEPNQKQRKKSKKQRASSSYSASSCCFKCGSIQHALWQCPNLPGHFTKGDDLRQAGELPYATCFVCHQTGHLSSQCAQNVNGIYVKGGCCKVCGSKQHLASHCSEKERKKDDKDKAKQNRMLEEVNVEDLLEPEQHKQESEQSKADSATSNDQAVKEVQLTKKRRVVML